MKLQASIFQFQIQGKSTTTLFEGETDLSHLVQIHTQVRDPDAVAAACTRLALAAPKPGTAKLFSGEVTGLIVQFPGWQYPVVIDPPTGVVQFDNFQGAWGEQVQLDRFLQAYAVEKCRLEARKRGHQISESILHDGSVKLQIDAGA